MAKNKISEWSAVAANNTDVGGIDIAEGCAPSGINNAIREMMAQVKDMITGADGDSQVVGGNLSVTGTSTLGNELIVNSSAGTSGQALVSRGAGLSPVWGSGFPSGGIIIWSGSSASIPSGWLLCDGTNSTPDLRNRFVIGAGSTYAVNATGGSADAIVVSHSHSATSSVTDNGHTHQANTFRVEGGPDVYVVGNYPSQTGPVDVSMASATTGITVATSISTTGSSGTNANLPPYYALCYIMKS